MAQEMVRCSRCYQVFDAEEGACPECGAPYQPPVEQPRPIEGLYIDKYAGTEFAPPPPEAAPAPAPRRNNQVLLIGGGAALIGAAVILAILFGLGALGGGNPTPPALIFSATSPPSPTPSLPPTTASTLAQLNDLKLSAHIKVNSNVQLSSRILGKSESVIVSFDGEVSNGDEWGNLTSAGVAQELRLVQGQVWVRALPNGKWSKLAEMPAYLVICPIFGLDSTKDLQLLGQETKDGQELNHFQSTDWWSPDISRIALADLSSFPIKPLKWVLDLWATPEGAPVAATFSGTNTAVDGTKLLDVEVSYAFTDVGVPQTINVPAPSPSVSASPSASPTR